MHVIAEQRSNIIVCHSETSIFNGYNYFRSTRPLIPARHRCPISHLIFRGPLHRPLTLELFTEVNATTLELVGHSPNLDLVEALARLNDSITSLSLIHTTMTGLSMIQIIMRI